MKRIIVLAGLVMFLATGCGSGGTTAGPTMTVTATETVTAAVTSTPSEEAAAGVTDTITDGIWLVGEDIKPGSYKTTELVDDDCYWAILVGGSNGDIIDNSIPGGGYPRVTLSKGQEFETNQCGEWQRQ